jgi:hypothetical protein
MYDLFSAWIKVDGCIAISVLMKYGWLQLCCALMWNFEASGCLLLKSRSVWLEAS